MSLKFDRKLPLILFIVFLMLTVTGIVFYQNTISFQDAILWERHSQGVMAKLDETFTAVLDREAGMRGFVITGNTSHLDGYDRAGQKIRENLSQLRILFGGNQEQTSELNRLADFIAEWNLENARKVELRKSEGFEVAILQIGNIAAKQQVDTIRTSVQSLKAKELSSAAQREKEFENGLYRTVWILIISSLAGVASLMLANYSVWREIGRRRKAEGALTEANKDLEEKIEKRTTELQLANRRLMEVGSEREMLLQNEQHARREAEIANRLRDEFMATVSHELKTPLNSILGWARLMKAGSLDPAKSSKALSTIIKNSETQNRLIEDLLDVARIISGKLELDKETLDMVEIVRHAIESVKPAANGKRVSIEFDNYCGPRTPTVFGDHDRMVQIFSNLLTNAIKFSREGGRISVRSDVNDAEVIVTVTDNGMGISPGFLPLVFERFRQDVRVGGGNGGLGLGLAIVRNLVEQHGGTVNASSEGENKGSVFTVWFPLADKPDS
jgi:signal transduction histidine kinase